MLSSLGPDLVGVQECWGDTDSTQADVLAAALGLQAAFVRVGLSPEPDPVEEQSRANVVMGVGLLSR